MQIGTWVKASSFVGRVAKQDGDGVLTIFNPGDRQMLQATAGTVQELPVGAVEVTVRVRVDVPHGLTEESLRRWVAAQLDPVLAARAEDSLSDAGLAPEPFRLDLDIEVIEAPEAKPQD